MVNVNKNIYKVNYTANSASRNKFSDKYFDILYFADKKAEMLREQRPQYLEKTKNMYVRAKLAFLRVACNGAAPKEYKKKEKQLIKEIIKDKGYYIPASEYDKKWFFVVTHHLYFVYKFLYKIKHKLK